MKCKVCGGTGTSNTCVNGTFKPCSFCDGTGKYEPFDADVELDKLDSEQQTNEEWFCQLPTEEKVSALVDMAHQIKARMKGEIGSYNKFEEGGYFREWLKEVHKE